MDPDVIMVVDDDDAVRQAITDYLQEAGFVDYQIISDSSAIWAITHMRRASRMITFLITDLDLTGQGVGTQGYRLAQVAMEVCGLTPGQIIILTASPPNQLPEGLRGCILMAKPIGMRMVVEAIRAAGVKPDSS